MKNFTIITLITIMTLSNTIAMEGDQSATSSPSHTIPILTLPFPDKTDQNQPSSPKMLSNSSSPRKYFTSISPRSPRTPKPIDDKTLIKNLKDFIAQRKNALLGKIKERIKAEMQAKKQIVACFKNSDLSSPTFGNDSPLLIEETLHQDTDNCHEIS